MLPKSCFGYKWSGENDVSDSKFEAKSVYLLPIFGSLMVGLACGYLLIATTPSYTPIVTPFPDTPSGTFSNALYFVIIIAVSATLFYFLLKWKSKKMITVLTTFALTAASVLLSLYYLWLLLSPLPYAELYVIILTVIITVLFDIAIFKVGGKVANIAIVGLGGALGVFLGNAIPVWSSILILAFLAVYDIIAVYKGPVGKIAESGLDQLKGLSYAFKDIQMGLGDLVFYSMLCAVMLLNYGWVSYTASLAGILGGSLATFKILERRGIFPGLPLPILLGLTLGLLGSLLPIF
jgi:presenilin-like A22 family membrane protease